MISLLRTSLLVLSIFPFSALAECPVPTTPPSNLNLVRKSPFFESRIVQKGGGIVEKRKMEKNGSIVSVVTTSDHPLAAGTRKEGPGSISSVLAKDTKALNNLPSLKRWKTDLIVKFGAEQVDTGVNRYKFVRYDWVSIGECKYRVWVVDVHTRLKKMRTTNNNKYRKFYSPELNVVLEVHILNARKSTGIVAYDSISYAN